MVEVKKEGSEIKMALRFEFLGSEVILSSSGETAGEAKSNLRREINLAINKLNELDKEVYLTEV